MVKKRSGDQGVGKRLLLLVLIAAVSYRDKVGLVVWLQGPIDFLKIGSVQGHCVVSRSADRFHDPLLNGKEEPTGFLVAKSGYFGNLPPVTPVAPGKTAIEGFTQPIKENIHTLDASRSHSPHCYVYTGEYEARNFEQSPSRFCGLGSMRIFAKNSNLANRVSLLVKGCKEGFPLAFVLHLIHVASILHTCGELPTSHDWPLCGPGCIGVILHVDARNVSIKSRPDVNSTFGDNDGNTSNGFRFTAVRGCVRELTSWMPGWPHRLRGLEEREA
ncbi:hypothetical protein V8F33_012269 [Rhypophila sp. PSN 637]